MSFRWNSNCTYDEIERESLVEGQDAVDVGNLLRSQRDIERFNVGQEMLDLTPADNRIHEGRLVQCVCDSHCEPVSIKQKLREYHGVGSLHTRSDVLYADLLRDDFEGGAYLLLVLGALPGVLPGAAEYCPALFVCGPA